MALKKSLANNQAGLIPFLTLFTSFSTLICCALPALLVSIGMGATLVGLVSTFPSLIWISEHKPIVFSVSFFFLCCSAIAQFRARNAPCPLDPELARACTTGRVWSKRILMISFVIWFIGAGFAFVPLIIQKLS